MESDEPKIHLLSGQFIFHSVRSRAAAFIRDGGKLDGFGPYPYLLVHIDDGWYIQDAKAFEDKKGGGWIRLRTKGFVLRGLYLAVYKIIFPS